MARTAEVDGRTKPRPGVDAQRVAIAAAATRLFASRGSSEASVQAICREADVSRPTFYRCFADKDELLAHLYEVAVDQYVEQFFLASPTASSGDGAWLEDAIDGMVDGVLSDPDLARFVLAEYGIPGSPVRDIVNRSFDRAAKRLRPDASRAERLALTAGMAAIQWILHETLHGRSAVATAKLAILQVAQPLAKR